MPREPLMGARMVKRGSIMGREGGFLKEPIEYPFFHTPDALPVTRVENLFVFSLTWYWQKKNLFKKKQKNQEALRGPAPVFWGDNTGPFLHRNLENVKFLIFKDRRWLLPSRQRIVLNGQPEPLIIASGSGLAGNLSGNQGITHNHLQTLEFWIF